MTRAIGLGIGAAALCAGWLGNATAPLAAEETRRIEIVHPGGGHLGVALRDVEDGDRGALVKQVLPGTPAEKAGIKDGDLILRYQGAEVLSAAQLSRMVRETPPGRKIAIEVSRGGATQRLTATLDGARGRPAPEGLLRGLHDLEGDLPDVGELDVPLPPMPPPAPGREHFRLREFLGDRAPRKLGIQYQELQGQLARYFHAPEDRGVLVVEVDEDGPAAKAAVKAGDVVVKLNGKPVKDGRDLRDGLAGLSAGAEASLGLLRDGKPLELKVKLGGRAERHGGEQM